MKPQAATSLQPLRIRELRDSSDLKLAQELVQLAYLECQKAPGAEFQLTPQTRVLGFFLGDDCVGSAVLHYPTQLPFSFLPEGVQQEGVRRGVLPDPQETIEVSRLAIEKTFRGSGILKSVFQHFHRELRLSGRSVLLISSDDRLVAKYRSVTFRPTGLSYSKTQQGRTDQLQVLVSRQKHLGAYGIAVDPIRWCLFVKGVVDSLQAEGKLKLSWLEALVYPLFRLFAPIARRIERRWLERHGYVSASRPSPRVTPASSPARISGH